MRSGLGWGLEIDCSLIGPVVGSNQRHLKKVVLMSVRTFAIDFLQACVCPIGHTRCAAAKETARTGAAAALTEVRIAHAGWNRGSILGLTLLASAAIASPAQASEKIIDFGQDIFFSVREATGKLAPNFNIRLWASDLEKALKAYRAGKFGRAYKLFKAAADDGDVMAHWWLGRIYQLGQGVEQSDGSSFYHFRQAALKFDGLEPPGPLMGAKLDSLVHVGQYYLKGVPHAKIKRQPKRAMRIFKTAAQFSHPGAQYGIGLMLYEGKGITKRPSRGIKWLTLSAQKHYPLALAKLGEIYWKNRKTDREATWALMWYALAQNAVTQDSHPQIINRYNDVAKALPENAQHDAHQLALKWSRRYPPPHHRIMQQPTGGTEE